MIRIYNPLLLRRGVAVMVRLCDGSRAGVLQWRGRVAWPCTRIYRYAGKESTVTRSPLDPTRTWRQARWGKQPYRRWEPTQWPTFTAMRKGRR